MVMVQTLKGELLIKRDEGSRIQMIFVMHVVNLLMASYEGIMCGISSLEVKDKLSIKDTPVVYEYSDVFLEELLVLPPVQGVELHRDLTLGVTSILKAVSISPVKLVELRMQFEEVLKKGFIRSSVSPWGA